MIRPVGFYLIQKKEHGWSRNTWNGIQSVFGILLPKDCGLVKNIPPSGSGLLLL